MGLCFHWHLQQQQEFSELFYCSFHLDTRRFLGIYHCSLPFRGSWKLCWCGDLQPIRDQEELLPYKLTVCNLLMEKTVYEHQNISHKQCQYQYFCLWRHFISYFNSEKGGIYEEVGAFIKNCVRLWYIFCFLNFSLYSHPSSKINSLKPVQRDISPLEFLGNLHK